MPESEPKPRLIELVAPGAGQGWKAVLKSGKAVVVHEIPVPAAEAAAAVPRIQRLAEHRHPALSPVLAWGTDPNGIWVAVEPNEGTPLGTVLSRGPLTPPAAAALGAAVLSGVAALHEDGIAMGGFNASAIRITGNGEVRLAGHPAAAVRGAPSQSDLRADVRSCGMAVCSAFGVDPAGAPAPPNIPPGLVVTMRSMASGAMGPAADRAQGALREMAAALLSPDRMQAAQSELALRAGGREMPSITPFLPKETVPPPAAAPYVPPSPREETPAPRAAISYEAPPRPLESYSSFPTTPPAPPAAPPAAPSPAPIPTWSEAPPRTVSPFETAAGSTTPAPAAPPVSPPASIPPSPALPTFEPPAPAPRYEPPAPAPRYEPPAPTPRYEPPAPTPRYEPPAASPSATNPPASTSAPAGSAAKPTWTAITSGVWEPAESEAAAAGATTATAAEATVPPTPARKPLVARRPSDRGPVERPSWMVPAIVAVVLILLLGTIGGIFLANRGKSPGGTAAHSPSPRTSPKASPSPSQATLLAVPTDYGPATASPVESVNFCTAATPCSKYLNPPETATACDLHGSCSVEVAIYFTSVQSGGSVSYKIEFFDRCSGQKFELPGPTADSTDKRAVVIPGNATTGLWALTLPAGAKAASLVAVTTGTTLAASAPLLLGANSCA